MCPTWIWSGMTIGKLPPPHMSLNKSSLDRHPCWLFCDKVTFWLFNGWVRFSRANPVREINEFNFKTSEIFYLKLNTNKYIRAKLFDQFSIFWPSLPHMAGFFPATTFFRCSPSFLGFWSHAYGYWKYMDLHGLPDISIWSLESLRFVRAIFIRSIFKAPGPPKLGGWPNLSLINVAPRAIWVHKLIWLRMDHHSITFNVFFNWKLPLRHFTINKLAHFPLHHPSPHHHPYQPYLQPCHCNCQPV